MMEVELRQSTVRSVLDYLAVATGLPTQRRLDELVNAYIRRVPWESAFRIAKRVRCQATADCPRWPEEFWEDAITRGGGGTCFESNYAFFSLLRALGYQGYLTINNMGDSIGCHTAIIVQLDGTKWLTDVGLPIYAPLPLSSRGVLHRATRFLHFSVRPDGPNRYQVERRPHPSPNAFTLIDTPVNDADYRAATTADYGENGLFLDSVIVNKIVDEQPWRFNMRERPWRLNRFAAGVRYDKELEGEAAAAVARHFGMDEARVRAAFTAVDRT